MLQRKTRWPRPFLTDRRSRAHPHARTDDRYLINYSGVQNVKIGRFETVNADRLIASFKNSFGYNSRRKSHMKGVDKSVVCRLCTIAGFVAS